MTSLITKTVTAVTLSAALATAASANDQPITLSGVPVPFMTTLDGIVRQAPNGDLQINGTQTAECRSEDGSRFGKVFTNTTQFSVPQYIGVHINFNKATGNVSADIVRTNDNTTPQRDDLIANIRMYDFCNTAPAPTR